MQQTVEVVERISTAMSESWVAWVLFVLAMPEMVQFEPNWPRDPQFSEALCQVSQNGVQVRAVECTVTEDTIEVTKEIPVKLF